MEKKEGLFNKSLMVTLANGRRVTARIKNPIAGPDHLMTSSEVATMDFARNNLGIPVPKILAWSSKASSNEVGAEFIIMETAPGVQLSSVWRTMDSRQKKNVVNSLAAMEKNMLNAKFSQYGSLYYKEDIPESRRASTLYAHGARRFGSEDKFCIGPLAHRTWYEDERANMDLNRGPWSSPADYLRSLALREEAWISRYAKPNIHDDPFRNVPGPQVQEEHLRTLEQYRSIVPALVPSSKKVLASNLWHPDLNPGNVFVSDDDERRVVSIIDWQGCWAGPAYLQMTAPSFLAGNIGDVPSGLDFPELPIGYEDMSAPSQAISREVHKAKMLYKLYEIKQLYPYRIDSRETRTMPVRAAGRTWKDGILPLRLALLDVCSEWDKLSCADQPCPLRFSRDEVNDLKRQRDRYLDWHDFLDDLRSTFGMRLYGWVSPNEYPSKRALLDETRNRLPAALTNEIEAILPQDWWPFRDTVPVVQAMA
ncbi:kinase-like domain-containing protein [Hygrophoropsis aurantiaca]|uniref:Kinase-like domain-containing protein n=1 Tax=Hygrophoropsis aurantiaca TaxID=72124 RepID=A0ACB8ADN1_9AGAM|nr:kinase-like domain-containing protein [Hygrophoropsis aurantiaca]